MILLRSVKSVRSEIMEDFIMKKRTLAFIFILCMLLPLFAACNKTTEIKDVAPPVFTVYLKTNNETTAEAMKLVELEVNRYLLQKADIAVQLKFIKEDGYDEAIDQLFEDMETYLAEESAAAASKKAEEKNQSKGSKKESSAETDESVYVQTEDAILDILESGGDIETIGNKKRFDIFLCCGSEKYYEYIELGYLSKLDERLTSDSKVLLDYIYPSFVNPTSSAISAARVNGATYGIPNNGPIGEYQYLVFDKEYLAKYGYDAPAMKSIFDLEDYLKVIKENETGVIPLLNVYAPNDVNFLYQDGYPVATDKNGFLFGTYLDEDMKEFFQLVNKFNKNGYIPSGKLKGDEKFAVRFLSGNEADIEALEAETGKEYEYVVYRNPVATAANTLENVFCVTKYCASSDIPKAMEFITLLNTDEVFRNLILYGVEDIHYKRVDGQIEKLNNDYSMDVEETGNMFLADTLVGEDSNKWEFAKQQNLSSVISPFISFKWERQELKQEAEEAPEESTDEEITDESTDGPVLEAPDEGEDEDKEEEIILEPDYQTIFKKITEKYWADLISGNGDFEKIWADINKELEDAGYLTALVDSFLPQVRKQVSTYPPVTEVNPHDYMNKAEANTSGDASAA